MCFTLGDGLFINNAGRSRNTEFVNNFNAINQIFRRMISPDDTTGIVSYEFQIT